MSERDSVEILLHVSTASILLGALIREQKQQGHLLEDAPRYSEAWARNLAIDQLKDALTRWPG
jgi:hypothetical protein